MPRPAPAVAPARHAAGPVATCRRPRQGAASGRLPEAGGRTPKARGNPLHGITRLAMVPPMSMTSKAFLRTTIALLVVGFLTVFGIVAVTVYLSDDTEQGLNELALALRLRHDAFAIATDVKDAETGQRGFLLTQDERYLQPYDRAVERLGVEVDRMQASVAGLPDYAAAAARLHTLIADKLVELDRTIELTREGRLDEALRMVRTDRGQELMDEIRNLSDGMVADTEGLVAMRTAGARLQRPHAVLAQSRRRPDHAARRRQHGVDGLALHPPAGARAARADRAQRVAGGSRPPACRRAGPRQRGDPALRLHSHPRSAGSPLVNIMGFTSELESSLAWRCSRRSRRPATATDPRGTIRARANSSSPPRDRPARSDRLHPLLDAASMDGLINAILKLSRDGRRTDDGRSDVDIEAAAEDRGGHSVQSPGRRGRWRGDASISPVKSGPSPTRLSLEQTLGNLDRQRRQVPGPPHAPLAIVMRVRSSEMIGNRRAEFEVEDNGRGIAPAGPRAGVRIVPPFRFAGPEPGEGIGLVARARRWCAALGGDDDAWIRRLERAPRFKVSLPREFAGKFLGSQAET